MSKKPDFIPAETVFNDLVAGFGEASEWVRGKRDLPATVRETGGASLTTAEPTIEYAVLYVHEREGWTATAPDLPGCEAVGDTLEEARNLIRYFIRRRLAELRAQGKTPPKPRTRAEQVTFAA